MWTRRRFASIAPRRRRLSRRRLPCCPVRPSRSRRSPYDACACKAIGSDYRWSIVRPTAYRQLLGKRGWATARGNRWRYNGAATAGTPKSP
ncbi:MAG: hypothetical protein ACK4ME_08780 [Fimbriimonadales bacterium]